MGGSVKTDAKLGFTLMVTAELNASTVKDPFVVVTDTKIEDAATQASMSQTYNCKCSTWREDGLGTSRANFQKKHWFDAAITMRHLKVLLHKMCPGLKVGLI